MFAFDTPTARLRSVAFIEGISYVVLLFVAMPLKYAAGMPMAVRIVGSAHGFLFAWLMFQLLHAMMRRGRTFGWAFRIGLASLLPFGTFFLDGRLKAEDLEYRAQRAG